MSQISHPYGYRLVTLRDWKSRWFSADKKKFREFLKADTLLREYLEDRLKGMFVSNIEFERDRKSTRLILTTSRPGLVIGRSGEGVAKIKSDIGKFMRKHNIEIPKDFKIDIIEIANPDADAMITAQIISEGIARRMPYRRMMKQAIEKVMGAKGVKGCRLWVSGLIGGSATMKRREQLKRGSVPLQFIRADIDYAYLPMKGRGIGIKVWINKGDSLELEKGKKKV